MQRSSIMRIAVADPKYVRVLRLRQTIPNRESIAKKAAGLAEFTISREYWWDGVYKFLSAKIPTNERGRFFCSHLRIEKESIVRGHLPKPDESIHLNIEVKLQQELLRNPRLHRIVRRLRSPLPRSYFDELLPLLARTRDGELDELIASTEEAMSEQVKHALPKYAVTETQLELLREALRSKTLTDAEVQGELKWLKDQRAIVEADIAKRKQDVNENHILFDKSKLKTFYRRWATSLNYLKFMEGQAKLLDRQIALFEG